MSWSTGDEKKFLWGLGTHTRNPGDRLTLLRLYLASMARRWNWGSINKAEVEEYVRTLIAAEEKAVA